MLALVNNEPKILNLHEMLRLLSGTSEGRCDQKDKI